MGDNFYEDGISCKVGARGCRRWRPPGSPSAPHRVARPSRAPPRASPLTGHPDPPTPPSGPTRSSRARAQGDNSPKCTADANSHRFKDTFEDVYTAASLQVPWYLHAGNHDWHTVANTSAEIAYTQRKGTSGRWNMPAYYYTFNKTFAPATGAPVTVQWVFIDTVILCGLSTPGQPELPPTKWHDEKATADELAWITSTLAASTADWLLVSGHYPVWSIAEHGSTDCLVKEVMPLLQSSKTAVYIGGHDHNLQFIDDSTGIAYVDCGPGHDYDTSQQHASSVPAGSSKFFAAPTTGGFCYLEFNNATDLTIQWLDGDAAVLHEVHWPNPRK